MANIPWVGQKPAPHLFRHSFATWALGRGMNPVQLKDILGHSSLATITNVYSHIAPEDAYMELRQLSSVDPLPREIAGATSGNLG